MNSPCPVCGLGHIKSETGLRVFEYRGAALTASHTEEFCDACGTLLQSPETVRENVRNIQRAKNVHDSLLVGEDIRAFRESFELTQRLAADLFGGGPTAFAKYECDEISHNVAMDRLLRLCMENPGNIAMLSAITEIDLPDATVRLISEAMESKMRELFDEVAEAFGPKPFPREPSANQADFQDYVKLIEETDESWELEAA